MSLTVRNPGGLSAVIYVKSFSQLCSSSKITDIQIFEEDIKMKIWLVVFALLLIVPLISTSLPAQTNSDYIDVNDGIQNGLVIVRVKPLFDIGEIADVFDRNPNTLARTASINPARIVLEFASEFHLARSRFLMSSGDGVWTLETAETLPDLENKSGTYHLVFQERALQMDIWDEQQFSADGKLIQLTARRTTGDNYVHLNEWELYGSVEPLAITSLRIQPDSLQLFEGWKWWHTQLFATTAIGEEIGIPLEDVDWASSDPDIASVDSAGNVYTHREGSVTISATYLGQLAEMSLNVLGIILPPEFGPIDPQLSTPAATALYEIPVLILRYLPTTDGVNLDISYAPDHWWLHEITLADMKADIDREDKRIKVMLEERSEFRGYKNPEAIPCLGYKVVGYITVYEPTPPGEIFRYEEGYPVYWPDFHQIFARFNVAHYVNDLGVQEIWFWNNQLSPGLPSYDPKIHRPENFRSIWESNMASPVTGDISNSNRYEGDLPLYNTTYILYDRNMRRYPMTLHVYGHQFEAMLSYVNQLQDGNQDLFWKKFVGQDNYGHFITGRCGWTHMPPNTTANYDYFNPTLIESDIEDWTPDRVGETKLVNADTWGKLEYKYPDSSLDDRSRTEANWYIYWMQNMPGYGNQIEYGDNYMTNWWLFTAKWDSVIQAHMGLYAPKPASLAIISDSLKTGIYKHTYADSIRITGGTPPYHMTVIQGALPAGLTLQQSARAITGVPTASGKFVFRLTINDHGMPAQTDTTQLTIAILNHPPALVSMDSITVTERHSMTYTARAVDPDSNDVVYAFMETPSWASIIDSTLTGTPPQAVDTSFVVTATDGELSDTLRVRVTVLAHNPPPRIVNLHNFEFTNDAIYVIGLDSCVVDSNHGSAQITWTVTPADSNLQVNLEDHTAHFFADGWAGTTNVLFRASDPEGASDTLTVKVTVTFPSDVHYVRQEIPETFTLQQNFPNPFNEQTTIIFGLPTKQQVSVAVYNLRGVRISEIFQGKANAGFHHVTWDAIQQASGVYFIVLKNDRDTRVRRCLLLK